ncbi:dihydrofolate reductase [Nocardia tenerifensis]|uniref:Dihydrofolate reductase n=1 Tax=Nocardia tenerifensis TaxID=228006 RepID=A0A318KA06_9NOCA|nr:dihydrofolate reductase family protein [Nocardia tenerifensis]PXX70926.1 dihydrofolate reductase [Nocardia tenerifensis]
MAKIVITTNATLDGVVEDPDGKEGSDRGGWFYRFGESDVPAWDALSTQQALAAEALLLGRRTDTWFGTRERPGEWADRTRTMPKYVISTTDDKPVWENSTVLEGNAVQQISDLKSSLTGEILVYGSYTLLHTLIEHHLADELRLCVFPVVLGSGRRLFDTLTEPHPLHLTDLRRVGNGIIFYTYEFVKS